jgi:hypothetical protein
MQKWITGQFTSVAQPIICRFIAAETSVQSAGSVLDLWWTELRWGRFGFEHSCIYLPIIASSYTPLSYRHSWCHGAKRLSRATPKITYFKLLSHLSTAAVQFTIQPKVCVREHGGWLRIDRQRWKYKMATLSSPVLAMHYNAKRTTKYRIHDTA